MSAEIVSSKNVRNDPQDGPATSSPQHETVATLPLSQAQSQLQETNLDTQFQPETYVTQPTQLIDPPMAPKKSEASSPSIQVAASSPIRPPDQLRTRTPISSGSSETTFSNSRGVNQFASAMAPPGTQFRSPYQGASQSAQSQPKTQPQQSQSADNLSDGYISDSSDDDQRARENDIKPSVFVRGGKPISISRVEDSPQNLFAQFMFNGGDARPPKRAADPLTDSYANTTRPKKLPRQTAPAKAEPPKEEMTLDDVEDHDLRTKIGWMQVILPKYSVKECLLALRKSRGNQEQAQMWLVDEEVRKESAVQTQTAGEKQKNPSAHLDLTSSDVDELGITRHQTTKKQIGPVRSIASKWSSTQASQKPQESEVSSSNRSLAPPSTKQQPQAPQKSISEKYAKLAADAAKPEESLAPRRKKLVRGRQASPAPKTSSPPVTAPLKPAIPEVQIISDDNDDDTDSGVGSEDEAVGPDVKDELLDFLNTCSAADLSDLSNQTQEVVEHMISKRPFTSLDQASGATIQSKTTGKSGKIRTTTRKVGERLVEACTEMWTGYKAIDQLVNECKRLSNPLSEEMKQAGFNSYGANGELEVVSIRSPSLHDSGIGTPSSSVPISDEEAGGTKKTSKPEILQKPISMSADLVLKDYQVAGFNWLTMLYNHKLSGLLCDDMGLGKTCQVITFLTHLKETGTHGPHLVIVPGSTLENWLREFNTFSPDLHVEPYYGGQNERIQIRSHLEAVMSDTNVIVTTYDMATKPDDARFLRKRVNPNVCVYDEGHALKNRNSARYNTLVGIPARFRLILTGTPVQNNLQELISLLSFILPSIFKQHEEDLGYVFRQKVKLANSDNNASFSSSRISRARSMMTPFILRRKKHQVLKQLPKKTNRVEWCELSGDQRALYGEIAATASATLTDSKTDASTRNNVLMDLRKAAIHPLLFRRLYTNKVLRKMAAVYVKHHRDCDHEIVFQDMQVMTDFELHRMCTDVERDPAVAKSFAPYTLPALSKPLGKISSRKRSKSKRDQESDPASTAVEQTQNNEPWMQSAKIRALLPLLQHNHNTGHRTLLFSQFTMVLDILELCLTSFSLSFYRLDGSTSISTRQDLIDSFRTDESTSIFMLSTKAGGLGLNLTSADRVIIFDGGFNPHEDLQAENRCHRVGQTREVEVVRLCTRDTVEVKMLGLGGWKLGLDERVAGGGGDENHEIIDGDVTSEENEKRGMAAVQDMVRLDLEQRRNLGGAIKDLKEEYMDGLKASGLKVTAVAS